MVATVTVLVLGVALSVFGYRTASQRREADVDHALARAVAPVEERLLAALAGHSQLVRDGAAFFAATPEMTRQAFDDYARAAFVQPPAVPPLGLGYIADVPADEREAWLTAVRADGAPGYAISPPGRRAAYAPILYNVGADPDTSLAASWGIDLLTLDDPRATLSTARDAAQEAMTAPTVLAVDLDLEEPPAGYALYLPLYDAPRPGSGPGLHDARLAGVAERRARIAGWLNVPFRAQDLLDEAAQAGPPGVDLALYDEARPEPIAVADPRRPAPGPGSYRHELDAHGRRWTLTAAPGPGFDAGSSALPPWTVLLAGIVTTLVVAALVGTVARGRARAAAAADLATSGLARSEARLRAIIASAPDLLLVVDADGTVVSANDQLRPILGYEPGEVVGRSVEVLVPNALRATHARHRAGYVAHPTVRAMGQGRALRARRADGTELDVEVSLSPLADDGRLRVVAVLRDVSERVGAARRLEQVNRQLARSNRELAEFADAASHDLAEPLRTIESYAGIAADQAQQAGRLDAEGLRSLATVVAGARRMRTLIEAMRTVVGVRADEHAFTDTDLGEVTAAAIANLHELIEESHAHVEVGELAVVHGSPALLLLLAQNLLTNALKFRDPARTPVLRISVRTDASGTAWSFADNGIGIPIEFQDRIFGMFRRLHPRDEYEGEGVGLAICRRVADLHGGTISVESAPGVGSTFTVRFPPVTPGADRSSWSPATPPV